MKKIKEYLKYSSKLVKNKYFIVTIIFLIWVTFFEEFNLGSLKNSYYKYNENIETIEEQEKANSEKKEKIENLEKLDYFKEKHAREEFLMKKPNEHIIILE